MQSIGLSLFVNTWNMVILRNVDNEAVRDASQTRPGLYGYDRPPH